MHIVKTYSGQMEFLPNVECPMCKHKATMRCYTHTGIAVLDDTVVCGHCGTSFSRVDVSVDSGKVVNGIICGQWKFCPFPYISIYPNCSCEEGEYYFEHFDKSIIIKT